MDARFSSIPPEERERSRDLASSDACMVTVAGLAVFCRRETETCATPLGIAGHAPQARKQAHRNMSSEEEREREKRGI